MLKVARFRKTIMTVSKITKADVAALSLNDLLGTPEVYVAPTQAAKVPRVARPLMTTEEKKAARNAAQKLIRSTPEGKAYANEASKKSIAAKKARMEAELATLKALAAAITNVPAEQAEANVEAILEEAAVEVAPEVAAEPTKKAQKPRKKSAAVVNVGDAPF